MQHRTSVGLDVHARSISACALVHETGELAERRFAYDPGEVARWVSSLPQPAACVYESGPCGFHLQRSLAAAGVDCRVGAASKMLRPPGDRVKTDRRDAAMLARMLAVGSVVEVAVPPEAIESVRDLCRARASARAELAAARQRLSKLLLRRGVCYPAGKSAWTAEHGRWLDSVELGDPLAELVLDELREAVRSLEARRARLDAAIAERARGDDVRAAVAAISALRGISDVTALSLVGEAGDFSRFPTARHFMSYVGLVPSESSSGESTSRGPLTRTGSALARTLIIEAAWHHSRPLRPLHGRHAHLAARGKPACVANAAVGRELAGFVWALASLA